MAACTHHDEGGEGLIARLQEAADVAARDSEAAGEPFLSRSSAAHLSVFYCVQL